MSSLDTNNNISVPPETIGYSQLDITENFGGNLHLKPDDWIKTLSLNANHPNPESVGLPSKDADVNQIYSIASSLSQLRESMEIPDDGVYCPVCHIANTQLSKLHTPCPECARELLKFGWD